MSQKIFKHPLFWLGLVIKFIFLFFGGAENFHNLFIPFLDSGATHLGENPWTLYPSHYFPYGSLQFLIFATPKAILHFIFGELALGNQWLSYFSIKSVLLLFDLALFHQLLKLAVAN